MSCIINWALFIIISLWLEQFPAFNWGNANSNANLWLSYESNGRTGRRNKARKQNQKTWNTRSLWALLPQGEHGLPNLWLSLKSRCQYLDSFVFCQVKESIPSLLKNGMMPSLTGGPCATFAPLDPFSDLPDPALCPIEGHQHPLFPSKLMNKVAGRVRSQHYSCTSFPAVTLSRRSSPYVKCLFSYK